MKSARFYHTIICLFFIFLLALPGPALSQDDDSIPAFTRKQLAQMLAPIALYPDALLSQVLMASTYPLEVIEAERWMKENHLLTGDRLDEALQDKDWEPSVKSLCHFPKVLGLMSEKITQTTNLGNAFLAQEDEVMDMIQELRAEAYKHGSLSTSPEQKVVVEKETIIIEPANPEIIYVPYYNPLYVYGSWRYPNFPPYYWGPSGSIIGTSISFWSTPFIGFGIGSWSYFDWGLHFIVIDVHKRPRFYRHDEWIARPGPWRHAPKHRRGVAYHDKHTAQKFGKYPARTIKYRRETRGFPEPRGTRVQDRVRTEQRKQVQERDVGGDASGRIGSTITSRDSRDMVRTEQREQVRKRDIGRDASSRIDSTTKDKGDRDRVRVKQPKQAPARDVSGVVHRGRQEGRVRDNAFSSKVDDGKKERSYSKRGRTSRERQREDQRRQKSKDDNGDDREGRSGRDRKRR